MTEERSARQSRFIAPSEEAFAAHVPPTRQGIESASKRVEAVAITVVPRLPLGFQASSGTPRFRYTWHRASQPFPVHAARFQMEVYRDTDDHSRHEDIPRFSVSRWEWDEKETERERMEGKDRRSRSCLPLGRASPLQAFRHFPLSPSRSHPFSARDRESERRWFYFISCTREISTVLTRRSLIIFLLRRRNVFEFGHALPKFRAKISSTLLI